MKLDILEETLKTALLLLVGFAAGLMIFGNAKNWSIRRDTAIMCLEAQKRGIHVTLEEYIGVTGGDRIWIWDETTRTSKAVTHRELQGYLKLAK